MHYLRSAGARAIMLASMLVAPLSPFTLKAMDGQHEAQEDTSLESALTKVMEITPKPWDSRSKIIKNLPAAQEELRTLLVEHLELFFAPHQREEKIARWRALQATVATITNLCSYDCWIEPLGTHFLQHSPYHLIAISTYFPEHYGKILANLSRHPTFHDHLWNFIASADLRDRDATPLGFGPQGIDGWNCLERLSRQKERAQPIWKFISPHLVGILSEVAKYNLSLEARDERSPLTAISSIRACLAHIGLNEKVAHEMEAALADLSDEIREKLALTAEHLHRHREKLATYETRAPKARL